MSEQITDPSRRSVLNGAILAGASAPVVGFVDRANATSSNANPLLKKAEGPARWLVEAESGEINFITHPPTPEAMRERNYEGCPMFGSSLSAFLPCYYIRLNVRQSRNQVPLYLEEMLSDPQLRQIADFIAALAAAPYPDQIDLLKY